VPVRPILTLGNRGHQVNRRVHARTCVSPPPPPSHGIRAQNISPTALSPDSRFFSFDSPSGCPQLEVPRVGTHQHL
jgi:hypothetical protein